jgi:death on curing protein
MSATPWAEVVDVDALGELYLKGIAVGGGAASPPKAGCVEGCLGNAWTAECYRQEDGEQVGLLFACYLMYYLAKDHCYTDGNKRVAWFSLVFVLDHYGLTVDASADEAEQFVEGVARGDCSADGVIDWVTARLGES